MRVMRSAECGTDHFMIRGKFKFRIQKKSRMTGVRVPKRINVAKLEHPDTRETLSNAFDILRFDGLWGNFRKQVYSVGVDVLGLTRKQHRDWFDENDQNISQLLSTKRELYKLLLNENLSNRPVGRKDLQRA